MKYSPTLLLYRQQRFDKIQIYKNINGIEAVTETFFNFNDSCTRGHLFLLVKPYVRTTLGKQIFQIRCTDVWNRLEEHIVVRR